MDIQLLQKDNFQYVVIDDFYTPDELKLIKEELQELLPFAVDEKHAGAAKDLNGNLLKNALGLFLDSHYNSNRLKSNILNLNRKIFLDEVVDGCQKLNPSFSYIRYVDCDYTLINYYKNNEQYKPHRDKSVLTLITFFSLGTFKKGQFTFPEYDIEIESKENRVVIFPGCIEHASLPIESEENNYRISMAQFLYYKYGVE
jgi:hypothetical protein